MKIFIYCNKRTKNKNKTQYPKRYCYEDKNKFKPLVLAAIIHNQFEYIHPFQDGNGRVGRLLLNFILLKNNYPPINIALEDRGKYYSSLRDYELIYDIKPMVKFLVDQYKKTLKKVTTKINND